MGLPDVSGLSIDELADLGREVMRAQEQKRLSASEALKSSKGTLDGLIGPDNPTEPSINSLTEVQLFTDDQIKANAALGLRLAFKAIEQVARTVRALVVVISRWQPM